LAASRPSERLQKGELRHTVRHQEGRFFIRIPKNTPPPARRKD
jgi:hypothetical protein